MLDLLLNQAIFVVFWHPNDVITTIHYQGNIQQMVYNV